MISPDGRSRSGQLLAAQPAAHLEAVLTGMPRIQDHGVVPTAQGCAITASRLSNAGP